VIPMDALIRQQGVPPLRVLQRAGLGMARLRLRFVASSSATPRTLRTSASERLAHPFDVRREKGVGGDVQRVSRRRDRS
jgi:hypothetical protein